MLIKWLITSIARTGGVILMLFIMAGAYGDLQAPDRSRRDAVFCKVMIGLSVLGILALNGV